MISKELLIEKGFHKIQPKDTVWVHTTLLRLSIDYTEGDKFAWFKGDLPCNVELLDELIDLGNTWKRVGDSVIGGKEIGF